MLVLSRRRGERIQIGESIVVKVLRSGRQVKIGIEAPPSVRVIRSELAEPLTLRKLLAARRQEHAVN